MDEFNYLTEHEKEAVKQVIGGADITSYYLATALREVEKKQKIKGHHLIEICEVMGDYDVRESLPYFGCIATPQGEEAISKLINSGE